MTIKATRDIEFRPEINHQRPLEATLEPPSGKEIAGFPAGGKCIYSSRAVSGPHAGPRTCGTGSRRTLGCFLFCELNRAETTYQVTNNATSNKSLLQPLSSRISEYSGRAKQVTEIAVPPRFFVGGAL
jgi:hypothetical protein